MAVNDRFNGVLASKAIKVPCAVATSANITLSGNQTIDGVAVVTDDRVLVRAQTNAAENGIYNVKDVAWERAADWDGNRDITQGTLITAWDSVGNASQYIVETADPIYVGTTLLSIPLYSQGASAGLVAGTVQHAILRWDGVDTWRQADRIQVTQQGAQLRIYHTNLNDYGEFEYSGNSLSFSVSNAAHNIFITSDTIINAADLLLSGDGTYKISEQAGPITTGGGVGAFWLRDDQTPMFTDDLGNEYELNKGGNLTADIVTATPPTSEGVTAEFQIWDADETDELASIGFDGSSLFGIRNYMQGGPIQISSTDSGGVERIALRQNPALDTALYHVDGNPRLITTTQGVGLLGNLVDPEPPTAGAHDTKLTFMDAAGVTEIGEIEYSSPGHMFIRNKVHNSDMSFSVENNAGTEKQFINAQGSGDLYIDSPGGSIFIRRSGVTYLELGSTFYLRSSGNERVARTNAISSGGLGVMNTKTGPDTSVLGQRVLTLADWEAGQDRATYAFSAQTTATDPTAGFFKVDNADYSLVTNIYVSDESKGEFPRTTHYSTLAAGDLITIGFTKTPDTPSNALLMTTFRVTAAATDNTGWWTIPVEYVSGSTSGFVAISSTDLYILNITRASAISGIADGTAEGTTLYWDATGGAWTENTSVKWIAADSQMLFPEDNDQLTPTIGFGDGSYGFHGNSDDVVAVVLGGVNRFFFQGAGNYLTGSSSSSFYCNNAVSSRTVPTLGPRRDFDTGIGSAGNDEMSLICGSIEILRLVEGVSDYLHAQVPLFMVERATPTTAIAGSGQLWVNSADSHLYFTDDGGTDYQISGAAGATTLSGLTDTNITTPAEGGLLMWDSTPGEWVDATTLTGAYTLSGFCIFSGNGAGGNALRADNDIQVSDNTALKFGTGSGGNGDIIIQWDGLDLEVTSIIANQTINFRDGMHMRFWDQTDTDWFDFYVSITDLVLTESGLTSVQWPSAGTLDLDMNDNEIQAPILRDYAIAQADYTPTGTSQALVYTDGPAFTVDLESASGNMTLSITGGPPSGNYGQVTVRVQQDGATARTVTWGGGDTYRHAGGTAHPMNTTLDGFTIYTLETFDAGTSWEVSGADYS